MDGTNVVIAHPKNEEQTSALKAFMQALKIKFEVEKPYNQEFVDKIKKSKKQYEQGKYTTVSKKQISQFLNEL